jgi:hypothetical protein
MSQSIQVIQSDIPLLGLFIMAGVAITLQQLSSLQWYRKGRHFLRRHGLYRKSQNEESAQSLATNIPNRFNPWDRIDKFSWN